MSRSPATQPRGRGAEDRARRGGRPGAAGAGALRGGRGDGGAGGARRTGGGTGKAITGRRGGGGVRAEVAALRTRGTPAVSQMLYRFASAGSDAAVNADAAAVKGALPSGALLGTQSYLSVKLQVTSSIAPWVPFIVAFGLIGLVMSVLIVVNVVSGTVAAGTRRIGVLKSIGFTPAQVVAAYALQVAVPAVVGCAPRVLRRHPPSPPLPRPTPP